MLLAFRTESSVVAHPLKEWPLLVRIVRNKRDRVSETGCLSDF